VILVDLNCPFFSKMNTVASSGKFEYIELGVAEEWVDPLKASYLAHIVQDSILQKPNFKLKA